MKNMNKDLKSKILNLLEKINIKEDEVVKIKKIHQGFTNMSFYVEINNKKAYQVRIGQNNEIVDRNNEFLVLKALNSKLFLYYNKDNGDAVKKWIIGRTLQKKDINNDLLKKLIKKINSLHKTNISQLNLLSHNYFVFWKEQKLEKEDQFFYQDLIKKIGQKPWVFSHNDLNLKNILFNEKNKKLFFIDFEWARINHPLWDLANFIREVDLPLTKIKFICEFIKISLKEMIIFSYLCTNFAIQWSYATFQTNSVLIYRKKTLKILNKYKKLLKENKWI